MPDTGHPCIEQAFKDLCQELEFVLGDKTTRQGLYSEAVTFYWAEPILTLKWSFRNSNGIILFPQCPQIA